MIPRSCVVLLLFFSTVQSAGLFDRSYEYVMNLGKNIAPSVMSIFDCFGEDDPWNCAKDKAGKMLDNWDDEVDKQRRQWREAADAEVRASGRALGELPSQLGTEVEQSLTTLADILQHGVARALGRRRQDQNIESKPTTTVNNDKKIKMRKPKPPKIHLLNPIPAKNEGRGFPQGQQSWVIGNNEDIQTDLSKTDARTLNNPEFGVEDTEEDSKEARKELGDSKSANRRGRGIVSEMWGIGEQALDALAEHVVENENVDNGIQDKSSFEEQRGKKKKKKKAILKLLILGAVLKAKIGTLLQILSFKLQVKFFIIALIGLAINLARFWVELKNKHHQPQKVIYYEHAQHQHHYEHEEEPGWGPWARNIEPEDVDVDVDRNMRPYRAQERIATTRPLLTLS
ncbi:PREDICTED: uncharacterized protein LOC106101319 [Papilio polytes]|uniref:uncharacterized protein LOC106101319 n=1 Tax=Papilio polytes TaxID=76194 RepID=UPI0006761B91|nr:PREDICTED: uncharacterized protein LOC106101319 [Papilio polytes]